MSKRARNSLNVSNNEGALEPAEVNLPEPELPTIDLSDIGFQYTLSPESDAVEFKNEITQGGFIAFTNFEEVGVRDSIYYETHNPINPSFLEMNGAKYYIENYLGGGSFGKVYKVYDDEKNVYAMKEMRYKDEAHRLFAIMEGIMNHILHTLYGSEYVPRVYGVGLSDDVVYIINELIDGISINGVLARTVAADKEKVAKQILYIVSTLLYNINGKPIQFAHGDLKPDNLMFDTKTQQIKLIDFGFSRLDYGDITIVNAKDFNDTYRKGRDLTSLIFIMYNYLLVSAEFLKPFLKYDTYDLAKKGDLSNVYQFLNANDMVRGYPEYVKEQFANAMSGGRRGRKQTRKHKQAKRYTRKMRGGRALIAHAPAVVATKATSKDSVAPSAAPSVASSALSKELVWHGQRDTMNAETLASLLTQAQVAHADTIAELYYEEKDPNLQLNLLRTLIFFKEEAPAFDEFVAQYRNTPDARPFLINTIHWGARIL